MTGWLLLGAVSAGALAMTWLVYPGVMIAWGERRSTPAPSLADRPAVASIIIATRAPPSAVGARLADLVGGDWPPQRMELIVAVDGDPTDYRFEALAPAPRRLQVVPAESPGGKAAALNAGVRAATGQVLIFTDTEQRFAAEAIPRLVAALGDPDVAAVSGALRIGNEQRAGSLLARYWRLERRLRAAEARTHSTIGVSGSIYAMRPSLWSALPPGLILDDLWVPMRLIMAGHRVGFEPGAVAEDVRITTHGQEFGRKVRTLTGNLQLVAWMPKLLLPWRNPVWIQFMCHKILRLATPFALLGLVAAALGAVFTWNPSLGRALLLGGIGLLAAVAVWPTATGARLRNGMAWALAMQGAILVATWNGLRGRWDVWKR